MKVYLDAGHGGKDSGAVGIWGRLEKDDAQKLTDLVTKELIKQGIEVIINKTVDDTLLQVANQANDAKVDLFISIHRNAFNDAKANGLEVYTCKNARDVTKRNANIVYNKLVNVASLSPRGVKESNFQVLKYTNAPAMLLEVGFVTNKIDNEIFDEHILEYANAIAEGISEILNATCDSKKYKVLVGTYPDKEKADAICREAKIKGFGETSVIE